MKKSTNYSALKLSIGILFIGLSSCVDPVPRPTQTDVAYVPVYIQPKEARQISFEDPKELGSPGKIYYKGGILFVVEWFRGIHLFDDTDPRNPKALKFLRIPGVTDLAISGSKMYANNLTDLVTIDITDPRNPTVAKVNQGVFELTENNHPPFSDTYFECPDESLGVIVEWKAVEYNNQKCFR